MVSLVPYGALIVDRKPSGNRGEDEKHLKKLDGMMESKTKRLMVCRLQRELIKQDI